MKTRLIISATPQGTLVFLSSPEFQSLMQKGQAEKTRASHVEPLGPVRRLAFRALRRIFGGEGRVAEWTRRWRCRWCVDLAPSGGPVLTPFDSRDAAIAAEIDWLDEHLPQKGWV